MKSGRCPRAKQSQRGKVDPEAYNAEGKEVWRRRLGMNGKILEEVYDRNAPYSDRICIPFLFQEQYYDHETGLAYNPLNKEGRLR